MTDPAMCVKLPFSPASVYVIALSFCHLTFSASFPHSLISRGTVTLMPRVTSSRTFWNHRNGAKSTQIASL